MPGGRERGKSAMHTAGPFSIKHTLDPFRFPRFRTRREFEAGLSFLTAYYEMQW
jgi:hypothetical protein